MLEIKLAEILKKDNLGVRVGTRAEGQKFRPEIIAILRGGPEKEIFVIDFQGIEVFSHSFADEVIAIPLSRLLSGEYGEKYLVVKIERDELCEDLEGALRKRGLAILRLKGTGIHNWTTLGVLSNELKETLNIIGEKGPISTGDLANYMHIELQACSNRVVKLGKQHLIRRIRIEGERGVKHENKLAIT